MNGYKYRANNLIEGEYRDTISLLKHEYFAPKMANLNDPFEGEFDEAISQVFRLLNSIGDTSGINENWSKINDFKTKLGIFSLEQKKEKENFPTNELLWAHYANSHKGFCIEYDVNKLLSSYKTFHELNTVKVEYESSCPKLLIADVTQKDVMLQKMFGTKSIPWKYENEIRVIFDKAGVKNYHPSALKSIYFGLNMDELRQEDIIKGLVNCDVTFYKIHKVGNTYDLQAELISENKRTIEKKNPKTEYEILKTTHKQTVENFHVLMLLKDISDKYLSNFISKFREEHATKKSNVFLYDDRKVVGLIDKYPLYGEQESFFAEHFITQSTFDSNGYIWKYPFK